MIRYSFRVISVLSLISLIISCKKEMEEVASATPPPALTTPGISQDVLKDSALFYTRDIYLWNTQVPASFNPRSYSDPEEIMQAIRQYSIEPGFTGAVDRYSFAIKQSEWDNMSLGMSSVATTNEAEGDFGLTVFFRAEGDLRVRLVEPNSPAGIAGVKRGWRITRINASQNINSSNSTFIVDNIYDAATISLSFLKPDGSTVKIDLKRAHYQEKPVYMDTVYNINNKKIGYLVFNSFLGNTDNIYTEFQRVFSRFTGVNDLIVDLRYNGGGYVAVQEKLANYLVRSSANGSLMMKQVYNAGNSGSNESTNFKKSGSLNLSRVYFIVGKATASASELLINNLKPYMEVKLVGNDTYGKPVGFFPVPVGEWYIFPVSFRTTNKNGDGNYFNGIAVNNKVADGLDKNWGDITEACLASAIRNITTGAFRPQAGEQTNSEPEAVTNGNKILDAPFLKVTIGELKNFK